MAWRSALILTGIFFIVVQVATIEICKVIDDSGELNDAVCEDGCCGDAERPKCCTPPTPSSDENNTVAISVPCACVGFCILCLIWVCVKQERRDKAFGGPKRPKES